MFTFAAVSPPGREDLRKEFWQVQFREKLKGVLERVAGENCLVTELKLRVAAGIWNKLADPEIEILKDCKYEEILFTIFISL